ncbi:hypothetical protein [Streptomyces sp. 184]|uniref:hypothetical protein n=1 Tax=Streptomyces sp. 184 TaxID=1827526 RepID=UPI003892BD7A
MPKAQLRTRNAPAAAANARAALDRALDTGAARCVDLVTNLIDGLDERTERPLVELREYVRERLAGT